MALYKLSRLVYGDSCIKFAIFLRILAPCMSRLIVLLPSDGESADDRGGCLGEMVRPGLQHQRGGGRHRRGRLPAAGGLRGALRRHEAPAGAALLRIL